MRVMGLLIVLVFINVAFVITAIVLTNLNTTIPYYGGDSAFLPQGGTDDDPHAYDKVARFLRNGPAGDPPDAGEGFGIVRYGLTRCLCFIGMMTGMVLSMATFNHAVLELMPTEGWGLWVKLAINAGGAVMAGMVLSRGLEMLLRSGILSNPYMLAFILGGSVLSISGLLISGTGIIQC